MAITRPVLEQVRFVSAQTGDHILDAYLEAAEKGGRTLADLMSDLFTEAGIPKTLVYPQWRGDWMATTLYYKGDVVRRANGELHMAAEDHTSSGSFQADLDAGLLVPVFDGVWADQAEAEAGALTNRLMSPLRTSQQITARLATVVEVEAGTNPVKLVTPATLTASHKRRRTRDAFLAAH